MFRRAIACKVEAVAGTPEVLTASEVIYAEEIKVSPNVASLARPHHLPTISKLVPAAGRSQAAVSFKVPMYGASAVATAPFWGALLQACGMAETITPVTKVEYKVATTSLKTVTIKVFLDGISVRLHGCRGTFSLPLAAGEVPYFNFTFEGLFDLATDVDAVKDEALLVGDALPAFPPKPFIATLLTIDGAFKARCEAMNIDIGNNLTRVPDANVSNYKRIDILERNPSCELDAEAVTRATKDFWDKLADKTAMALYAYVGAEDSGPTGTGALNSLTDVDKNWLTNQWASHQAMDNTKAVFPIASNTATVLTVTGTPATGEYLIGEAGKIIHISMPKWVLESINDEIKSGSYSYGLAGKPYMDAGDDELVITVY